MHSFRKAAPVGKVGAEGARSGPGAEPSGSSSVGKLLHVLYIGVPFVSERCSYCASERDFMRVLPAAWGLCSGCSYNVNVFC